MNNKLKDLKIKDGKMRPISARLLHELSDDDLIDLEDMLREEGVNPKEYLEHSEKLAPKKVDMPPIVWRNRK